MSAKALEIQVTADINSLKQKMVEGGAVVKNFADKSSQSIFNLTEKLKTLESNVFTEKSRSNIAAYNAQIQTTKKEIEQLSNVGKEGFDKFGNSVSNSLGPLTKAYSGIRQIAYILPGIGIAGIFNIAFEAISKLAQGTEYLGYKQEMLNKVYADAAKGSAEQVSKISLLASKLNDLSISQADRIKYAKEYNEIADKANQIDTTQINNLDLINSKISQQISLIEQRALAKAAEATLSEQAQKVINAQFDVAQFEKFKNARKLNTEELKSAAETDKDVQQKAYNTNRQFNSDNLTLKSNYLKNVIAYNKEALDGQKKYNEAALKLAQEKAELDKQVGILSPLLGTDAFSKQTKDIKVKVPKVEVSVDKISFKPQKGEFEFDDEQETAAMISEALSKLYAKGIRSGSSVLKGDLELNPNIYFSEQSLAGLRKNLLGSLHKAGISTADRILENGVKIKIPIEIATTKELNAALDASKKALQVYQHDINAIVNDTLQGIVSATSEGIAAMISNTGNLGGFFSGIFKTLGSGLKQLGEYLVKTYATIAVLQKIKFSNPYLGIALGVALEVLGSVISSKVSQTKAFATGVRGFGGGTALVGERGPELMTLPRGSSITPNAQLRAMSGGGEGGFITETIIRGQDLRILLKRADAANRRNS